jgi:hypothetical protein
MKISQARHLLALGIIAATLIGCASTPHTMKTPPASTFIPVTGPDYTKVVDAPAAILPSDFVVYYEGIIAHAQRKKIVSGVDKYYRRAIVIQGNTFGMRHEPLLGVYGADLGSLNNLAGEPVQFCDHYYCWVLIRGIEMRVVDEVDGKNGPVPVEITDSVDEDKSFVDLVPHLKDDPDIDGGDLRVSLKTDGLPPPPSDGYFEMAGGRLSATPFFKEAQFIHNGSTKDCRQFAELVFWAGHTSTRARLQIKSKNGGWETVKLKSKDMPLRVVIANLGTEHYTSRHFILNEKVVANQLPTIYTDTCQVCQPSANHICYLHTTALNDVAGCSNSQWP